MAVTDAPSADAPAKAKRPNPIAVANATGIGQKLLALRGNGGFMPSPKELAKLAKAGDGVSMMNQAPKMSADSIGVLESMIRSIPTTRRHEPFDLNVGDGAADFSLVGSHGETVSLSSLRGRKPFALRLTRAAGTGIICPACVPDLDGLTRTYADFDEIGAELLVVFPIRAELAKEVVDNLDLPYPIYADPDWTQFKAYETHYSAGAPLPAWVVGDQDGVIQFLWRATDGGLYDYYAQSTDILEVLRGLGS